MDEKSFARELTPELKKEGGLSEQEKTKISDYLDELRQMTEFLALKAMSHLPDEKITPIRKNLEKAWDKIEEKIKSGSIPEEARSLLKSECPLPDEEAAERKIEHIGWFSAVLEALKIPGREILVDQKSFFEVERWKIKNEKEKLVKKLEKEAERRGEI